MNTKLKFSARWILVVMAICAAHVAQAAPDFTGYWMVDRYIEEVHTVDGNIPPLKPDALAIYKERSAQKKAGNIAYDPTAKCIMPGVPRVMFLPYAIEFLQQPNVLTQLFAWNHLYRRIDLSGKPAVVEYPMYMGVSTGKWEGSTLVITTVGRLEGSLLDATGLPHSGALKVIERYSLSADGKALSNLITIDDPETYTQRWDTKVTYHKLPDSYEFAEDVCLDRVEAGRRAVEIPKK